MARVIELPSFHDSKGSLTVIEKILPFQIKRIYYIYSVGDAERGGHRHKKTMQAAICVKGSCRFYCNNGKEESEILLDSPGKCLILENKDWHIMTDFTPDAVLLVLASEYYDVDDYIDEKY